MQASCRIRTYEFDLNALTAAFIDSAIFLTLANDLSNDRVQVASVDAEVNKARSSNLG